MEAHEARDLIRAAEAIQRTAENMLREAKDGCRRPSPGSIVRGIIEEKLMRVVLQPGGHLTLDTLTDAGLLRGEIPWHLYDIVQEAPVGGAAPMSQQMVDALLKKEGAELAELEKLNQDPEFQAALARAEGKQK